MNAGLVAAVSALFGLPIGSFLNVVIWRVPRNESVVHPPSHCPGCDNAIAPHDNIPVVSWLLLRGKCRHCKTAINTRYPLVEAFTALTFGIVGWRFAESIVVVGLLIFSAALIALCAIDLEHMLLPNKVIYPTAAMVLPLFALAAGVDDQWSQLGRATLGGLAGFSIFYAIWFVAPRAMGFGDVRLSALLGFVAAYFGWQVFGAAMLLPFVIGSIAGIAVGAPIVLAPMAVVGAIAYIYGERLIRGLTGVGADDPAGARLTAAGALSIFVGAGTFLVLSALNKVERGRHIPFGPSLALGTLIAVLAHGVTI